MTRLRPRTDGHFGLATAAWFVGTRLGLVLVGVAALALAAPDSAGWRAFSDQPWLDIWARWDSAFYRQIVADGYALDPPRLSNAVFFPLYPLLIDVVTMGSTDTRTILLAGLVISNVSLAGALAYLVALAGRDFGAGVAKRTAIYLLVFPATLFLSAVYAESLFLFLAVGSFYHARDGAWGRAGLLGGLATLTRPYGVVLLVPAVVEWWQRGRPRRAIPALALIPAGGLAFLLYLWWELGSPTAFFDAQRTWDRELSVPFKPIVTFLIGPISLFGPRNAIVDVLFAALFVGLTVAAWRMLPRSYGAFAGATLLLILSTGRWVSMPRYGLALFPVFIVLALWGERQAFHRGLVVVSAALAALFMWRFALWGWVA